MFASLPMYDRPENAAAHDALWAGVCARLDIPNTPLDRRTPYMDGWARPDLVLGQICNLPYRAKFKGRVTRIGTGDYGLTDTPAGYYHSVFVVREQDAERGLAPATLGRFAYNDALSQSGWGAPLAAISDQGLTFYTTLRTGAHINSMNAVLDGHADLAAIDAVTWRMFEAWEPRAKNLSVIARTRATPAQMFITGHDRDPDPIRIALSAAIADLSNSHAQTLGLWGLKVLPDAAYDIPLPTPPALARDGTLQSA